MDEEIEIKRIALLPPPIFISRKDCEKIRKDLQQQKDQEKQTALDELRKQKQLELVNAQNHIDQLEEQIN